MQQVGSDLILSATDLSGFLACRHLTTLERAKARGEIDRPYFEDPGNEVLRARGQEHEQAILARYRAQELRVAEPTQPDRNGDVVRELARTAEETLELMRSGVDVIYQGCLFDGRWLGRPDFLIRVESPTPQWTWSYEVVDAKLARSAKAGAVLQIAAYSEMLGRVQDQLPALMHLAHTGRRDSGSASADGVESFPTADYSAYYRSVKRRYLGVIETEPATYPEPCEHCSICDWWTVCDRRLREDDHLSLVAGITKKQRKALAERGVHTLEALSALATPLEPRLESVSPSALHTIREQARLQAEGRRERQHRYEILAHDQPRMGLLALPEPNEGDLFFDLEGDPFAFSEMHDEGLVYLFGWVDARGEYEALWALSPEEERARFETFIDRVIERLERWPELHIYHYADYEPRALKRLAARYATREEEVDRLLRGQVLVDLYRVVRQGVRASVESYSIKKMEPLYGFQRAVDLRAASSALANFEAWLQLGSEAPERASDLLRSIEGYNKDDCLSTLRLRDWLEDRRSDLERSLRERGALEGRLPRPAPSSPEAGDKVREESKRVQPLFDALTAGVPADPRERSEEQHARWLLAHLLSWHRRENKSVWWEYFRLRDLADAELIADPKPVGGLEYERVVDRVKKSLVHRYRFPPQELDLRPGRDARDPRTEKSAGEIVAIDEEACTIDLKRGIDSEVPHPRALIPFDLVNDDVLRESLAVLAEDILAHGFENAKNRAAADLLLRRPPRAGQEPGARLSEPGEESLAAAQRIARRLDRTVLPVQGPPGTGKTYIGARMILSLLMDGKRVGITGPSHKVIANLVEELCSAADEQRHPFRGIQKGEEDEVYAHPRIERAKTNERVLEALQSGEAEVAAGTAWLWARPEMARSLDVLVVDEAGQLSLASVLAASAAASSLVLLGDPRQLEQPQKGVHPPGTGVAALTHLVGGDTLSPERGIFLEETWRLHPDVCAFTSERFYRARLKSKDQCQLQTVDGPNPFRGTGLRFWPVEHEGNTSESPEEVEAVAELVDRLLCAEPMWVDMDGARHALGLDDVLVIAPYNAQVAALRERLPAGARVGTVDKFQGQEAPVVIYSTATSTAEDAPRGMRFLYSPNRLNVATSRARCVAIWVGSPALLGPDCRSVDQMWLANGFARFGEMAE